MAGVGQERKFRLEQFKIFAADAAFSIIQLNVRKLSFKI